MIERYLDAVEDPRLRPMILRMGIFMLCWDGSAIVLSLALGVLIEDYPTIISALASCAASGALTFVLPGIRPRRDELAALAEYGFPVGHASRKDQR